VIFHSVSVESVDKTLASSGSTGELGSYTVSEVADMLLRLTVPERDTIVIE
jgi:hypothetical protein